jgi:hypothetical protein
MTVNLNFPISKYHPIKAYYVGRKEVSVLFHVPGAFILEVIVHEAEFQRHSGHGGKKK